MDGERWKRLEALFHAALERQERERPAFLDAECAGDAELRDEVESLLGAHGQVGGLLPTEISAPPEEAGPKPGTVVEGRYRIEALLARGGMGAVYRATHLALDRPVALKVVRDHLLADARMTDGFLREARTISHLKHPHIVTVHDFGSAPEVGMYLVMELVNGRSLRAELKELGRLPVDRAVALMRQVCSAVHAAHESGVIHRDLKPDNVVLEETNGGTIAKVLDFGIAKLQGRGGADATPPTLGGAVLGTPAYMSPEQCCGEAVDGRADVYALGCVLYHMLVGRPPFQAETVAAVMAKHVTEEPAPPRRERPEIPAEVEAALLRALAKLPADRFQTVADLGHALGGARTTDPTLGAIRRSAPPNNLPRALTSFVGRRQEIAGAEKLLTSDRLVTFVGPGGVGKTRLALEVAGAVVDRFRDGVWLVELGGLADPALVLSAIGAALGVREESGRAPTAALADATASRELLLVLDNCEHLADACARAVGALLRTSAGLRVLATSREPLGIVGEVLQPVLPLSLPPPGPSLKARDLERFEAARLFVERATASRPAFVVTKRNAAAVADLCRRLDGIPLAIELAAARARSLTVEQMLAMTDNRFRLLTGGGRTRPERQQTLRAAIDWSHDLLTDEERVLFRRLSVFAGGWTLESAECLVPSAESPEHSSTQHSALDLLTRLVDRSLVIADLRGVEARYRMFETIRAYAAEKLRDSGDEEAVLERFDAWFVDLGVTGAKELMGPDQARWFERFEAEHDNMRAVLRRGLDGLVDVERCLRLCVGLRFFWYVRGYLAEGLAWFEEFLARSESAPVDLRAGAYYGAAGLAVAQCDYERSEAFLNESIALCRQTGNSTAAVGTLLRYGYLLAEEREYDRAFAACTEVLALCEDSGDTHTGGVAHYYLGLIAVGRGEFAAAVSEFERALAMIRETPNARGVSAILHSFGEACVYLGDLDRAGELLSESLTIAEEVGDRRLVADTTSMLGAVDCERGDYRAALARYREALAIQAEISDQIGMAYAIEGISRAVAGLGSTETAGRLEGCASGLRRRARWKPSPSEQARSDRFVEGLRAKIGEAADREIAEGAALSPEDAVAFAFERADVGADTIRLDDTAE